MTRGIVIFVAAVSALAAENATIRGRVIDADTGRTIPSTVEIRTPDGKVVTEHASFLDGFRSPGVFEALVPAGRSTVTVSRGFDYGAEQQELELRAGESREIEFKIRRRTPLRKLGWYTGDNHVHMIHGERRIDVDFPYLALAARAEGLDYASIAQHWNLPEVTPEALDEACRRVSAPDFTLAWNLEAPKNYWRGNVTHCAGHGWTVAMRGRTPDGRSAIEELTEMSAWDYESEKPPTPNFESHAFIHSLGGIVTYTHPHRWWWGEWGGKGNYPFEKKKRVSNMAQELPFDTVVGPTYDAIDILMKPQEREVHRRAVELWFLLLNRGYRMAATASSDTTFDNPGGGVPGKVRVYTRIVGSLDLKSVARAIKAGKNFVTSGPLLLFEIGSHQLGDVVPLKGEVKLKARLRAWPSGDLGERLTKVELIRNGEVVRTWDPKENAEPFDAAWTVAENGTAWYIARCYGSTADQVAMTNPIYFEGRDYRRPEPARAHVTGTVRDSSTGRPLDGIVEVIEMNGRNPVPKAKVSFRSGRFEVTVPGTARLRVNTSSHVGEMKSVFMDSPQLLETMLNMTPDGISDWSTYEKLQELLDDVRLQYYLKPR